MSGTVIPGGTYRWKANTEILGVPGTPSALTLTVADPSGGTVAGFPIALGGLGTTGTGQYYYDWVTLTSAALGTYTATWAGTLSGLPILATDTVEVGVGGAYADLATFRQYLRTNAVALDSLDPESNLETLALNAAARAIEDACGRLFNTAVTTVSKRYFAPRWTRDGWFSRLVCDIDDVADTTGMIVNADATGNGSYTTTLTAYRVGPKDNPAKGFPYTRLTFDLGVATPFYDAESLEVQALWGWSVTPATIVNANLLQASRYLKRRDAAFGVTGSPEMGTVLRLLSKLDPDVALMLGKYAKVIVA